MATTSHNDIALAIYTASKDKQGTELSLFVDNVLKFLIRKRLISKSSDILKKLEKISNKEEGIIVATISSVKKIDEHTKKELTTELLKKYNAKKIVLKEKEVPTLLGGIKIEVDDEVIDLTIFNKLKKLQVHLTR